MDVLTVAKEPDCRQAFSFLKENQAIDEDQCWLVTLDRKGVFLGIRQLAFALQGDYLGLHSLLLTALTRHISGFFVIRVSSSGKADDFAEWLWIAMHRFSLIYGATFHDLVICSDKSLYSLRKNRPPLTL